MVNNPHPLWRQERCADCKSGVPYYVDVDGNDTEMHNYLESEGRLATCKSPHPDVVIAELEISNRDYGRIVNELNQEIAELERDKARLDWMITRQRMVFKIPVDREYIDAAMKLEPK